MIFAATNSSATARIDSYESTKPKNPNFVVFVVLYNTVSFFYIDLEGVQTLEYLDTAGVSKSPPFQTLIRHQTSPSLADHASVPSPSTRPARLDLWPIRQS